MSFTRQSVAVRLARPAAITTPGALSTEEPGAARSVHGREAGARRLHASRPNARSSLVDPASSHMLVSKIKPCMSQCMPN